MTSAQRQKVEHGYPCFVGLTTLVPRQSFQRFPALDIHFVRAPNLSARIASGKLRTKDESAKTRRKVNTHGSRSQIMTISSSLPLASQRPECAHRTVNTGPVCIVSVHSDLGGLFESSEAGLRIGFVLHIRILASRPPVAMREPSGWTCTENMDSRLAFWSLFAESLCMTQAGFVKCICVRQPRY